MTNFNFDIFDDMLPDNEPEKSTTNKQLTPIKRQTIDYDQVLLPVIINLNYKANFTASVADILVYVGDNLDNDKNKKSQKSKNYFSERYNPDISTQGKPVKVFIDLKPRDKYFNAGRNKKAIFQNREKTEFARNTDVSETNQELNNQKSVAHTLKNFKLEDINSIDVESIKIQYQVSKNQKGNIAYYTHKLLSYSPKIKTEHDIEKIKQSESQKKQSKIESDYVTSRSGKHATVQGTNGKTYQVLIDGIKLITPIKETVATVKIVGNYSILDWSKDNIYQISESEKKRLETAYKKLFWQDDTGLSYLSRNERRDFKKHLNRWCSDKKVHLSETERNSIFLYWHINNIQAKLWLKDHNPQSKLELIESIMND